VCTAQHACSTLGSHAQRKASGRDVWDRFIEGFDIGEQEFFGFQYQAWDGADMRVGSAGGTYRLGRSVTRWLILNESAHAQLGDPTLREDGWSLWKLECRVKFYLQAHVTDLWDPFTR
jgi:hypothetical protein